MKNKSMKVITLTTALALALSATAWGTEVDPDKTKPGAAELAANGNTTISIFQSATNPQISYTVPLYVTMAVVNGQDKVMAPDNYILTNTTPHTGTDPAVEIGVTTMTFEKIKDTGFQTVAAAPATDGDAKAINLKIGGATMPTLLKAGKEVVPLAGSVLVTADNKPKALTNIEGTHQPGELKDNQIKLEIKGLVAQSPTPARVDDKTAAQFRLKYTVSLMRGTESLGAVYAGDDHTAAGLPEWDLSKTPTQAGQ